jgi:enolase
VNTANRTIRGIDAFEILDSRGYPTLRVSVELDSGHRGVASVPSGASTGRHEALELRDRDLLVPWKGRVKSRRKCSWPHIQASQGKRCERSTRIDHILIELDGTENKSALGANAILGVSMAVARAAAAAWGMLEPVASRCR